MGREKDMGKMLRVKTAYVVAEANNVAPTTKKKKKKKKKKNG